MTAQVTMTAPVCRGSSYPLYDLAPSIRLNNSSLCGVGRCRVLTIVYFPGYEGLPESTSTWAWPEVYG